MSILEEKLKGLIAKDEGVTPDKVTLEFVREKRTEEIYPCERFSSTTKYGGYHTTGLRLLTRQQIRAIGEKAKSIWDRFA